MSIKATKQSPNDPPKFKKNQLSIPAFVRLNRKSLQLTQPEFAALAGVGLRFIRELERGKETLRLDKVNKVLQVFGFEVGPVKTKN